MNVKTLALLLLVFLISSGISNIILPQKVVSAESKNLDCYVEYTVVYGDTLWQLAKRRNPNGKRDTREIVYEIMETNRMKSPFIQAGQTLKLPQ